MSDNSKKMQRSSLQKVLMVIFSLVCAFLLWVYVTETNGTDIDRTLPGVKVIFEGETAMRESRGHIISDVTVNSVKVNLYGNRRTLSSLEPSDLAVSIDLDRINKTGNYSLAPEIIFPDRIDTNSIVSSVSVPESISFYVDKLSSRPIPVVGVFNGSAAEGYTAEPLEFDTETVKIYGPEKILSQVKHALVEVSREDLDKTLSFETAYVLIDQDGNVIESDQITFERDTVIVTLPINAVKQVDLVVDLIPGAGVSKENVKIDISPVDSITLTGDAEILNGVNSISLAKIDLSTVDTALTETYKIVLPNDTENTSGEKEATVTLSLVGISKKVVTIDKSNISVINNSEGYVAEVMNTALDNVVIRGPERVVNGISSLNVRAVADLADYGTATGIVTVPVKIYINGTTDAGAFGEYKVYVNITQEE